MSAISAAPLSSEMIHRQIQQRRTFDQIGRMGLGITLIATAVIFLVVPVFAVMWMQAPFLGVFVQYPDNINRGLVAPFFQGMEHGIAPEELQSGDKILSIGGTVVTNGADVNRVLRGYQVGDVVQLTVSDALGSVREIEVSLIQFPLFVAFSLFVIPYVVGLLYIAIGLWVYRNRREETVGHTFLMVCCAIGLTLASVFDIWTTHIFAYVWYALVGWGGGMLAALAFMFPNETRAVAERPILRWVPAGMALLVVGWGQALLWGFPGRASVTMVQNWSFNFAGGAMGLFIVTLALRSVFSASPAAREQSRVVLFGTLFSFVPFILSLVLQIVTIQIGWVLVAFLFFPLVVAYSIVQYSVLDTGRLLSFTTTYTIMAIVVVVGYFLLVTGLSFIGTAMLGSDIASNPLAVGVLTFALVIGFQPLRTRLQKVIDDAFFRTRGEYQERLTAFRHDLTVASGLGDVIRLLKQQVREAVKPTHAYVFLRDPQAGSFMAAGEAGRPDTDIRFEQHSGLIHALSTSREVIFLELNKPLPVGLAEEHARLAVLKTSVMVPLQGQERLAGFVAVGNKRSGETYSIQDLRFVQALAEQASLAVERAQAIGDLERRVRELDVLSQVSQAVNFTTDPDILMELVYAQASRLIDTTNFYIIMNNPVRRGLSYAFFLENDERIQQREGEMWPNNIGLAGEVVRTGRPILADDYMAECAIRGVNAGDTHHLAWMGVPLNAGAVTLGVLVVASYVHGTVFTEDQLKVFWAIADQAASALDKARLFREIETRARQLATLNDISKELSSTLELESLLKRIMRSAVEILGAEAGSLFLVDDDTQDLIFRVVEGGAQNLVGQRVPPGKGIVGESVDRKAPVVVNNVLDDQRWFSNVDRETAFQTQSLLAVPLLIQDKAIGVVEVINKTDHTNFTEDDSALLTTFASQAAVAIDNARLYEATDAELTARVDELQNLQRIDRELNRTLQYDRVIKITLDWALRTTGSGAGAIAMITPDGTTVELVAMAGFNSEFLEKYKDTLIPANIGIVGRVLASGKPEFVPDVKADPDFVQSAVSPTVSQITVPILRANRPIGVLVLESHIPGLFSAADSDFTQRLVEHAAVAIENARLVQEIESANRSKTEFVSFVAHELKNPMTSIRGYTDLLKAGQVGPVTDAQVNFLGTIRTNVDRMTRLVSDLADVARIESGHLRLELSPISVKNVVDEVLRGMQAQIDEKKQELVLDIAPDLPSIFADHTRMVQVVLNLISNAYKYTPEAGKIWIGAKVEDHTDEQTGKTAPYVHHWVKDTGIGMAPEDLEKLFTKFFRTQRGKDMAQGTGLGLNIVKNLVERHNGKIWVESAVGEGTTFRFLIPVATEDMQQPPEPQTAE